MIGCGVDLITEALGTAAFPAHIRERPLFKGGKHGGATLHELVGCENSVIAVLIQRGASSQGQTQIGTAGDQQQAHLVTDRCELRKKGITILTVGPGSSPKSSITVMTATYPLCEAHINESQSSLSRVCTWAPVSRRPLSELRIVVTAPTGPNHQFHAAFISSGCQPSVLVHGGQYLCRFSLTGLVTEPSKLLLTHFFPCQGSAISIHCALKLSPSLTKTGNHTRILTESLISLFIGAFGPRQKKISRPQPSLYNT